jgi:hypothetical protein
MMTLLNFMTAIYWGELSHCKKVVSTTAGYTCSNREAYAAVCAFAVFLFLTQGLFTICLVMWRGEFIVDASGPGGSGGHSGGRANGGGGGGVGGRGAYDEISMHSQHSQNSGHGGGAQVPVSSGFTYSAPQQQQQQQMPPQYANPVHYAPAANQQQQQQQQQQHGGYSAPPIQMHNPASAPAGYYPPVPTNATSADL